MKEYNRKTKRWEDVDRIVGSLKKPDTCKGKKPHDFVLVIPKYYRNGKVFNKEQTERFYELEDSKDELTNKVNDEYEKMGLIPPRRYRPSTNRYYVCSVCGKEKYEDKK